MNNQSKPITHDGAADHLMSVGVSDKPDHPISHQEKSWGSNGLIEPENDFSDKEIETMDCVWEAQE